MRTRILHRWKTVFLGGLLGISSLSAQAEGTDYTPTPENLQARKEFQDGKFGIFLHWGIYSMFGQGEWYMNTANIDCHEYAKAASGFYPSRFNAQEWVAAIKASGAKYICITSRHHDGFSMFNTKYSDYDIVDATPFKRDVIKELAEECRKQGIRLHLYYSHLDWTREDYYPLGNTGHGTGRTSHGEWATYYQFMNHQLTELLTNYGPIGAIWFDGMWDQPDGFDWKLEEQYELIHKLQPACLIGNNHHKTPYPGEDFQMFERDLPGENKAGLSGQSVCPPAAQSSAILFMRRISANHAIYRSKTTVQVAIRTLSPILRASITSVYAPPTAKEFWAEFQPFSAKTKSVSKRFFRTKKTSIQRRTLSSSRT